MPPVAKIRRALVGRPKRAARAIGAADVARCRDATIAVAFEPKSGNLGLPEAAQRLEDNPALLIQGT